MSDRAWGFLLLGIGLAVTVATYLRASTVGGTYIVAYGAIITGLFYLGRSYIR